MAILKTLPGVVVTIEVAGKPLQEHEDENLSDNFNTVTRYVEAQSDQEFKIKIVTTSGAGEGLEYQLIVDGKTSDKLITGHNACVGGKQDVWVSVGWPISKISTRRYKFMPFTTGEPFDSMLSARKSFANRRNFEGQDSRKPSCGVEDLGVIAVQVYHLSSISPSKDNSEFRKVPKAVNNLTEEFTKGKALTHAVGFGRITRENNVKSETQDIEYMCEDPIAFFKFFYRSREALKAELIIPRTPSPPPLEGRDTETLDQDDIADLQKQLKAAKEQMQAMAKIKKEEQEDNSRPRKAARPSAEQEIIELD